MCVHVYDFDTYAVTSPNKTSICHKCLADIEDRGNSVQDFNRLKTIPDMQRLSCVSIPIDFPWHGDFLKMKNEKNVQPKVVTNKQYFSPFP